MANISTLTVSLVAKTAKFHNDMKRARTQSQKWGKAVAGAGKAAAAGIGVATTAMAALVARSLKVVDQQQKMADRLGLTQKALAGLALAGEQTGNSQQNLQLALQRSTRRIAEAAQGTGEAVKSLDELGLSARELTKLSPDEIFIRLAGAFEDVSGQSDKVRLAFKLFDSEGVGLVNTLALGEEGIRDFITQSERMGLSLDRNQTRAIEDANNAGSLMKASFVGLGNELAARFAPSVEAGSRAVASIVTRVTQGIPAFAAWATTIFGVRRELNNLTMEDLALEAQAIDSKLYKVNERLSSAREIAELQLAANKNLNRELVEQGTGVTQLVQQVQELEERWNAIIKRRVELKKVLGEEPDIGLPDDGTDSPAASPTRDSGFSDRVKYVGDEIDRQKAQWEEWRRSAVAAIEATLTPSERLQERAFQINRELENNPFFTPELARRQTAEAVDAYIAEMERMKETSDDSFSQIEEFQRAAFQNMQGILGDFLFDPFKDGLKGMLKGFADMLRRMVAQLLAQKILTSFFGGFGFDISGTTTTGNAIGIGRTDNRARIVGENGPELFQPGASGSIRPLGALNYTSNLTVGNSEGGLSIATLIPILEEWSRKTKGEILDAFDRGSYA